MNKFFIAAIAAATLIPSAAMAQSFDRDGRNGRDGRAVTKVVVIDRDRHDARGHGDWNRPVVAKRLAIGAKVDRDFIGKHDVIKKPARYRLAKPAANARWLKVRDDAVLVNLRTGRVLAIANNLFR